MQEIDYGNYVTKEGNPVGGFVKGTGLDIEWQYGPLGRGKDRKEPNGAFVEDVIQAAVVRLEFYQDSQFHCLENAIALGHLHSALEVLHERTRTREKREVEGTHSV